MRPPTPEETRALFAGLADDYERYASLLSFGQDPRWKRFLVSVMPAGPEDHVLDVATGTGAVAAELVRRRGCRVTGIDLSADMLGQARRSVVEQGVADRVSLLEADACAIPFDDASFDGLTVTYLLRYVEDPGATLAELTRVLRPGATLASLEFGVPPWPPARLAWKAYVKAGLPAVGALAGSGWWRAGRFLAHSIPEFYDRLPLPDLVRLYADSGLDDLAVRRLSLGGGVVIWGRRAPSPDGL